MPNHDAEFWIPCQPSRASAIAVVVGMLCLVLLASGAILAAVV
jgi:hypothetical protein